MSQETPYIICPDEAWTGRPASSVITWYWYGCPGRPGTHWPGTWPCDMGRAWPSILGGGAAAATKVGGAAGASAAAAAARAQTESQRRAVPINPDASWVVPDGFWDFFSVYFRRFY